MSKQAEKVCVRCGRTMQWRAKWSKKWEQVKYCSDQCRRTRATATDSALEDAIVTLLGARARDASICPSEVARQVGG